MSDISPWSPYCAPAIPAASGRVSLPLAFADVVKVRTPFEPYELPEIFDAPSDDGENDACRHSVWFAAVNLAEAFADGSIATFARPIGGGESKELGRGLWEIDDPLSRFATGCLNLESPFDPDAIPSHRIFVDSKQFAAWLAVLKPLGPLTNREIETIIDPQLRARRSLSELQLVIHKNCGTEHNQEVETPISHNAPPSPEWMTIDQVVELTTFSRSSIYKWEEQGLFPKHIKIGVSSRWDAALIREWMRNRSTT